MPPARNVIFHISRLGHERNADKEGFVLFWLFMALILVTAPPLLIVGWLQLQHMRKQGPLKARQIIVLTIALVPAAFCAIQLIWMFVWSVAAMIRR